MYKTKRKYTRRTAPRDQWGWKTWLIVPAGSLLLVISLDQVFKSNCITDFTFYLGIIGAFFVGRIFEKLW